MCADRYRDLFEYSVDPILVMEGDRFTDCNRAAHRMLGYPDKRSIVGKHPWELSPTLQSDGRRSDAKGRKMLTAVAAETHQTFEWDHLRQDGSVITVEVSLIALPSASGLRLHCAWRDVSRRKLLEKELLHSQKMDVVGKLAGAIAHDFNNQLVPILGYSDLLQRALDESSEGHDWARQIARAATLSTALINKLMTFSRKGELSPVVQDANARVGEILAIVRRLIGARISVRHSAPDEALWVNIGEGAIEQIVLNLASNARDAMVDGGELEIEVDSSSLDGKPAVLIRVADNGSGMDESTRKHIFEPFFTTKDVGLGTGLGMSTVADLVNQAGGRIAVTSAIGAGTTVEVWLPTVESPAASSAAADAAASEAPVSRGDILVLEDNPHVAQFVATALERNGFRVRSCASAGEASQEVDRQRPDLILSDIVLAGRSGPAFIRQLLDSDARIPYAFMSGSPGDELARQGFDTKREPVLKKPFTSRELLDAVSTALR